MNKEIHELKSKL